MGKQTDAIVYYCDHCRKPVIGTNIINNTAEGISTAHQISILNPIDENVCFKPVEINKFIIPITKITPKNINQMTNMADAIIEVEAKTKYYCKECADYIIEEYTELCGKMKKLIEWK